MEYRDIRASNLFNKKAGENSLSFGDRVLGILKDDKFITFDGNSYPIFFPEFQNGEEVGLGDFTGHFASPKDEVIFDIDGTINEQEYQNLAEKYREAQLRLGSRDFTDLDYSKQR